MNKVFSYTKDYYQYYESTDKEDHNKWFYIIGFFEVFFTKTIFNISEITHDISLFLAKYFQEKEIKFRTVYYDSFEEIIPDITDDITDAIQDDICEYKEINEDYSELFNGF